MLKLALIGKTQDFFSHYAEEVDTNDFIVITPNPAIADLARNRFMSLGKSVNSLTISKFIQEQLQVLVSPDLLDNYKGKSELLFLLGAIWQKANLGKDFIAFKRAFNLLTEFRSFSVADNVLETVLENYDPDIAKNVLWLQRFLNQLELIDEHGSYFLLSERLRTGDLPPDYVVDRKLVFYGFDFLTASQVDLLKSFALRDEVIVPFYQEVYEKTMNLDWIRWFDDHNLEKENVGVKQDFEKKCDLHTFSKNYLGKQLKSYFNEEQHDGFVLGTKRLSSEHLQEIPFGKLKYKIPVNLFDEPYSEVLSDFTELVKHKKIENNKVRVFLQEKISSYSADGNFRHLKVALLFLSKVNEWEDLSDENDYMDSFSLKVIHETVALDLPRINIANLDGQAQSEVYSLKEIEQVKNKKIVFALNSNHGGVGGSEVTYSENVEKYLVSIGPLRRADLEDAILKAKFKEFVADNDVEFMLEEGLLEHDSGISKLFDGLDFELAKTKKMLISHKKYVSLEVQETSLVKMSASRLQKYLECPQKYYLSYVSKLGPYLDLDSELNVLELGQIEHKVIEEYFKQKDIFEEDFLDELISTTIKKYELKKKIIHLDEYLVEVKAYTQGAIKVLLELKIKFNFDFKFEHPFYYKNEAGLTYNGSIDLLAINKDFSLIIDFKRSNRVFTSFNSILNFEQIQLWFYMMRMSHLNQMNLSAELSFGYMDLSDMSNTMLFTNEKELVKDLKQFRPITKVKYVDNFDELIIKYENFETDLLTQLKSEERFSPAPRTQNSCTFCPVNNTCPRE
jgi:hypothetical protein